MTRRAAIGGTAWMAGAGISVCLAPPAWGDVSLIEPYTEDVARRAPRRRLPYTALYRRGRLIYVAARHDTGGATFAAIDRAFARGPHALVVEGFPSSWGRSPERIASLVRSSGGGLYLRGEPGHALARAITSGVPFWGGEPDEADLERGLTQAGYAPRDIAGVEMLQWLPQGRIAGAYADNQDPRFRDFLDRTAAQIAADFSLALVFSREIYERWHERQFGVSVYEDEAYDERLDPTGDTDAAALSRAMTLIRDRHIFGVIMGVLAQHERTLVVYGGAHLATQARALQAALGRPRIV